MKPNMSANESIIEWWYNVWTADGDVGADSAAYNRISDFSTDDGNRGRSIGSVVKPLVLRRGA